MSLINTRLNSNKIWKVNQFTLLERTDGSMVELTISAWQHLVQFLPFLILPLSDCCMACNHTQQQILTAMLFSFDCRVDVRCCSKNGEEDALVLHGAEEPQLLTGKDLVVDPIT